MKKAYSRLPLDEYFLSIAELVAHRGTCLRRRVGCVLVNSEKHSVATGYNGVPRTFPHCFDQPCEGATSPSGVDLDKCLAVHAEVNAFLQLQDRTSDLTAYITTTPCFSCAKMIANSPVKKIVSRSWYAHTEVREILQAAKISVITYDS